MALEVDAEHQRVDMYHQKVDVGLQHQPLTFWIIKKAVGI